MKQNGFSGVIVIVVIAAIIAIGASFWALHEKKSDIDQQNSTTQTGQNANVQPKNYTDFAVIGAWQVKFGLDKPSSQFKVGNVTVRNGNQIVTITNSAQQAVYKECGKTVVERSATKSFYDPATMQMKEDSSNSTAKQIGSYWYKVQPLLKSCFAPAIKNAAVNDESQEDEFQSKLDAAGNLTDASLSNLESAQ